MQKQKVIDQNYLREPNTELYNYLEKGNYVVMPEYCCMEAYKGDSEINIRRSIEIIKKYPKQIIILKSDEKVIVLTMNRLKGLRSRIVDKDQTKYFQKYCEIVNDLNNPRNYMHKQVFKNRQFEANEFFNTRDEYTEMIRTSIRMYKDEFTKEELKIIKNNGINEEIAIKIDKRIKHFTALIMSKKQIKIENTDTIRNWFLFRLAVASNFLTLNWIVDGGYENVKLSRMQNDIVDMYYAVYSTYYDGLLTNDKKMEKIYRMTDVYLKNI